MMLEPLERDMMAAAAATPFAAFGFLMSLCGYGSASADPSSALFPPMPRNKSGTSPERLRAPGRACGAAGRSTGGAGHEAAKFIARLLGAGRLAVGQVTLGRDSWVPEGPDRRLLLGVLDESGTMIDVAAVASHRRDEWALRTGAGEMLGMRHLLDAHADLMAERRHVRLRLYATPLDWLAGGGDGVCVLRWGSGALGALRSLGERATIEVDGPGMAEKLKAMLAYGGLPRVSGGTERWERAA